MTIKGKDLYKSWKLKLEDGHFHPGALEFHDYLLTFRLCMVLGSRHGWLGHGFKQWVIHVMVNLGAALSNRLFTSCYWYIHYFSCSFFIRLHHAHIFCPGALPEGKRDGFCFVKRAIFKTNHSPGMPKRCYAPKHWALLLLLWTCK